MNDPIFWRIGAVVVQEAVIGSLLLVAAYQAVVLLFRCLEWASRRAKTAMVQRAPAHSAISMAGPTAIRG